MSESSQLSQEKFKEILIRIYKKGEESEKISTIDLINDINQQLMSFMDIRKAD